MKSTALRMVALPVMLAATVSFASAQEGAKAEAREAKQDAKNAASQSGNAIKDSWITLKVHSQFVPEDALKDSDIDVDTSNGVVMLNGTVASEAGRAKAISIAKATDGVKNVMDHLRIAVPADSTAAMREAGRDAADKTKDAARTTADKTREATGTTGKAITDGWIKSKIAAQYVTEDSLDNSDIDIDVSKGMVALKGAVRTAAAKDRATAIAKGTDGVKGVKNDMKIDPSVK
jgi:hyperosmotically inducible periplasmic protein